MSPPRSTTITLTPNRRKVRADDGAAPKGPSCTPQIAVLHGAVAFRRSLPEVAFVAGPLAMLVLTFSPSISNEGVTISAVFVPSSLMYFVLLYSVAAACERLPAMVALVTAHVGSLIVTTRTFWSSDERPVFPSTPSGMPVIVATVFIAVLGTWGLGRLRRTRLAYVGELEEKNRRAGEDGRNPRPRRA